MTEVVEVFRVVFFSVAMTTRVRRTLTLTWPKPMVTAAAQVKPFITGKEMKSSRKPEDERREGTMTGRAASDTVTLAKPESVIEIYTL